MGPFWDGAAYTTSGHYAGTCVISDNPRLFSSISDRVISAICAPEIPGKHVMTMTKHYIFNTRTARDIVFSSVCLCVCLSVNTLTPEWLEISSQNVQGIILWSTGLTSSKNGYTGWAKKVNPKRSTRNFVKYWPILKKSFNVTISRKFAMQLSLTIPPHLKRVTTLPCEMFTVFQKSSRPMFCAMWRIVNDWFIVTCHVLNENHRIFNVKTKENDFYITCYHFWGLCALFFTNEKCNEMIMDFTD